MFTLYTTCSLFLLNAFPVTLQTHVGSIVITGGVFHEALNRRVSTPASLAENDFLLVFNSLLGGEVIV